MTTVTNFHFCSLSRIFAQLFIVSTLLFLSGCANQAHLLKKTTYTLPIQDNAPLVQAITSQVQAHPEESGFYPLGEGKNAFIARLALIDQAKHSLDIQYYIYRDDMTSAILTWHLYQAAKHGVRIRLLLDDMQSRNEDALMALASLPNVKIRLFNPLSHRIIRHLSFLTNFSLSNRRMHNKALIADRVAAITGGRNIGDEYFSANKEVEFGDLDLLLIGTVVPEISQQFDLYWNSQYAHPIQHIAKQSELPSKKEWKTWNKHHKRHQQESQYFQSLLNTQLLKQLRDQTLPFYWGKTYIKYDHPNKVTDPTIQNDLLHQISSTLTQAKEEFILISPYFVPTQSGTNQLIKAVTRGIDVTIITNSLASNDVFAVHGWYAKHRKALLAGGVKIYEIKAMPARQNKKSLTGRRVSLHAKSFLIDRKKLFVGSFNFDPRSAHLNTEMGVFIKSPEFANLLIKDLSQHLINTAYELKLDKSGHVNWINNKTQHIYTTDPDAGLGLRFAAWLSGKLPIEMHL